MVAEKTEIYCARALYRRGETRSKTQSAIRAAECFRPFHALIHAELVRKHETGHEKGSVVVEIFEKHCGLVHGEER